MSNVILCPGIRASGLLLFFFCLFVLLFLEGIWILYMNIWPSWLSTVIKSVCMHADGVMDTKPDLASRVTFIPSMLTFEEEMFQKFGSHISSPPHSKGIEDETTVTWQMHRNSHRPGNNRQLEHSHWSQEYWYMWFIHQTCQLFTVHVVVAHLLVVRSWAILWCGVM